MCGVCCVYGTGKKEQTRSEIKYNNNNSDDDDDGREEKTTNETTSTTQTFH